MINKEMKAADLASVTGGGPIGTMMCLGAYNGYMDSAR